MPSLAEWNTSPARPRATTVLERIIAILDAVKDADGALSVTKIALQTSLPKSTVSRLAADLTEQRYLERTEEGVTLGLRMFELGARASLPRRVLTAAAPVMNKLAELTGERVGFWVHQGGDMISVATMAGRLPELPTRAGMRSPVLTTASGKAFLAFCDDRRVVERVSAPLEVDAVTEFKEELTRVRESVVARDPGVSYPGISAVASPVFTVDRSILGALSVAGPSGSMDPERVAPMVRAASATLTRRFGAA